MVIRNKNRKEDMKLLVSLGDKYVPGTPFKLIFSSGSSSSSYTCELGKNGEYINCEVVDDNHIICLLDNHNLPCGRLVVEVNIYNPDSQMPDGDFRLVSKDVVRAIDEYGEYGICLTDGASDWSGISNVHVELLQNMIKGEAATIEVVKLTIVGKNENPRVVNEGTPTKAKLHFYLPEHVAGGGGATITDDYIIINEDGEWVIGGVNTHKKAVGTDGHTPLISVSPDGYLVIDGVTSEVSLKGDPMRWVDMSHDEQMEVINPAVTAALERTSEIVNQAILQVDEFLNEFQQQKEQAFTDIDNAVKEASKSVEEAISQFGPELSKALEEQLPTALEEVLPSAVETEVAKQLEELDIAPEGVACIDTFEGYDETLDPSAMQEWLQSAVNTAAEKWGYVLFPHNKTFVIAIPLDTTAQYAKTGGSGIIIPSNTIVNLNGSTIKAAPNDFHHYAIAYFPEETSNSMLINGALVGERGEHTMSGVSGHLTDEWSECVQINGKNNSVVNLDLSEVRGDGVYLTGYLNWNSTKAISGTRFETGKLNNGTIATDASSLTSPMITLSAIDDKEGVDYYIRPTGSMAYVHTYSVAYYDDSEKYISSETSILGYKLHLPSGAKKMRFSFSNYLAADASKESFWICSGIIAHNNVISKCNIHHCGRNGIVPVFCDKSVISKCYIHHIGGTNNEVCIDIEGTSFLQGDVDIEDCILDQTEGKPNGIAIAQGHHITIRNCTCHNAGIYGMNNDIQIDGCTMLGSGITLRTEQFSSANTDIYPSTQVRNCMVQGRCAITKGIVENCRVIGSLWNPDSANDIVDDVEFINCDLECSNIMPAKFTNCRMRGQIYTYAWKGSKKGYLEFIGCKMHVPNSSCTMPAIFRDCDITHTNANGQCTIRATEFVNNKVTHVGSGTMMYYLRAVSPQAVIRDNTFDFQGGWIDFIHLYTNDEVKDVFFERNHVKAKSSGSIIAMQVKNGATLHYRDNLFETASNGGYYDLRFVDGADCKVIRSGNKSINTLGISSNYRITDEDKSVGSGKTTDRPKCPPMGAIYYDTDLSAMVVCTAQRTADADPVWTQI